MAPDTMLPAIIEQGGLKPPKTPNFWTSLRFLSTVCQTACSIQSSSMLVTSLKVRHCQDLLRHASRSSRSQSESWNGLCPWRAMLTCIAACLFIVPPVTNFLVVDETEVVYREPIRWTSLQRRNLEYLRCFRIFKESSPLKFFPGQYPKTFAPLPLP